MQRNKHIVLSSGAQIIVKRDTDLILIAKNKEYILYSGEVFPVINTTFCFYDDEKHINDSFYDVIQLINGDINKVTYWLIENPSQSVSGPLTQSECQFILDYDVQKLEPEYKSIVLFQALSKIHKTFYLTLLGINTICFFFFQY